MKNTKAVLLALLLAILLFIIVFPIWVAISGTFSAQWELERNLSPVFAGTEGIATWSLLPTAPTLKSLVEVLLDSPGFFVMFWNSVSISFFILIGQLLVDVPAAWALAHFPIRGKKTVLNLYIVLMLMPFQVLMFPQYLVLNKLRILDTLGAVILPAVFSTFPVFILHRFFQAIPKEILEAARLDGAGEFRVFLEIGIPMGTPGILSVSILTFLDSWNMIEQPMTYLKTRALWPLSLFLPEIGMGDMGVGFAAAFMMLVPALLLFLGCQEYLEQGIAMSGGKD